MTETKDLLVTLEDLKAVHDNHVGKLNDKVNKVAGKGLSANDYDDAAKAKVDAIPDDPKYTDTVYNDSELQKAVSQLNSNLQNTVGNLNELNTEEKANLVAAINEALTKSGGEIAPADVQKIVDDYLKANPPGAGAAGKDGTTPTIGENGNWYLGDTATGNPSRGAAGAPGAAGTPGKDGTDGHTPAITAEKSGKITTIKADGTTIATISDGTDGTNGADGAPGKDGSPGAAGKDGTTPTIGENGNWYLGDTDTGKPSRGAAGENGDTGDPATLTDHDVQYAKSSSGTVVPSGMWYTDIPDVAQGEYLWTRTFIKFNTGSPIYAYSVSHMGLDGTSAIGYVDTALNNAKTVAKTATLTVAGWTGSSAPYTQSVTVAGLTDAKRAMAYPVYGSNADSNIALKEACGMVSFASRSGGVMTFTCLEDKPAVDIPITVEVYV